MAISGTEYKMHGWDAICRVGRFLIFPGLKRVVKPRAQLSLWPTPKGGFSIADAHAIKVSRSCNDFLNSIVTDW